MHSAPRVESPQTKSIVEEKTATDDHPPASTWDKIRPLAELRTIVARLQAQDNRVVLCHGVFDLVHPGHIRHLAAAKRQGDILIVTITPDQWVNKGPGRPVFAEHLRAENLAALQDVDYVAIHVGSKAAEVIRLLRPDVYVLSRHGVEPQNNGTGHEEEETAVQESGVKVEATGATKRHGGEFPAADWKSVKPSRERGAASDDLRVASHKRPNSDRAERITHAAPCPLPRSVPPALCSKLQSPCSKLPAPRSCPVPPRATDN